MKATRIPVEWLPVAGFEGRYWVSNDGRVRNRRNMELKIQTSARYPFVGLWRDGKTFPKRIHRLVAIAFLPPPEPGQTDACHDDGDEHNNHVSNLRWDTHAGNMLDRHKHGTAWNQNTNKTHCKNGHEFTPENTYRYKEGRARACRTCARGKGKRRHRIKVGIPLDAPPWTRAPKAVT